MRFFVVAAVALALLPIRSAPAQERIDAQAAFENLPPAMRLGLRVELVRRQLPVDPTLVIVPDADVYIAAVARWRLEARFPVLIDDGSAAAREDIARFARAFAPARVVRWSGEPANAEPAPPLSVRVERAIAAAWSARPDQGAADAWEARGLTPPGVVVASAADGAWTAALALGAGRGQPVLWIDRVPGRAGGRMNAATLRRLDDAIVDRLEQDGRPWSALGDDIEAVTIALNAPSKVPGDDGPLALTDRIGRHENGERWAWAGQVLGDEARAAYNAMCSLFLQPSKVWLFDGYKNQAPFSNYDMAAAAELFRDRGAEVTLDGRQTTGGGIRQWRSRAGKPLDAGIVLVNSSGTRRFFDLTPGRGRAADVPTLSHPAAVHIVHSFSAQDVDDAQSIAGRWLAHGAFVYAGSVHEPFLRAFFPPGTLAGRLLAPSPFAAAVRVDGRPVWRINVYGDPLFTLGPGAQRLDPGIDLPGAALVSDDMRTALAEERFPEVLRSLSLMGRDFNAAQLVAALLRERSDNVTPETAQEAIWAAIREGEAWTIARLLDRLPAEAADDQTLVDAAWRAAAPAFASTADAALLAAFKPRTRPDTAYEDAAALAPAIRRVEGRAAATAWVRALIARTSDAQAKAKLDALLNAL